MSNVPTGISAYRHPETGELTGSYPTPRGREILKLANEMASNRDGYGVAFYNDALLAFADKITAEEAEEAARWKRAAEANIDENVRLRAALAECKEAIVNAGIAWSIGETYCRDYFHGALATLEQLTPND